MGNQNRPERRRTEEALREDEEKYRTLFEASTDAVFLETLEGNIVDCNDRDTTGREQAEDELRRSREQMRDLSVYLQSVREEERTRIAREIHDELGQALTALKMDLSWLEKRLPEDPGQLSAKTRSMSALVDATIRTVQRISSELRPGLLDDLGLPSAIEWQAEEFEDRTGIACEVALDPEEMPLSRDISTAIFRIFQETLTNVARHAEATQVTVSLREKTGGVELMVRDNGRGITESQVSGPRAFGLMGIRERARFLNGSVEITGVPGKGTAVTVRIPPGNRGGT